jgi:hypothetical protein
MQSRYLLYVEFLEQGRIQVPDLSSRLIVRVSVRLNFGVVHGLVVVNGYIS